MTYSADLSLVEVAARALVDPSARSATPHLVIEVEDFEVASRNAWDQEQVFPVDPSVMERLMNSKDNECEIGWLDLRECMAREFHAGRNRDLVEPRRDLYREVYEIVSPRLAANAQAAQAVDDIAADLRFCVLSQMISRSRAGFWERLLFVYEHGFWPCGWQGSFPDVRFLGYRFVR